MPCLWEAGRDHENKTIPLPIGDCVLIGELVKNVILNQVLNLFQDLRIQDLINSTNYETLK
jgi:hypothetical protein